MAHRRPVLAGSWYPATASRCQATIEQFQSEEPVTPAQAGIVPHAGWDYSGAIAWGVFEALAAAEPQPQLLVLFGTHMGPRSRPHVSRTDAFETPLGPITAARELAETLARDLDLGPDPADDPRSSGDNTVEVQLPFIKHLWPDVQLLVLAPPAAAEAVDIGRRTIELAQQIHKPLAVVGSTDLTHYGPRFGFTPHGTGPEAFAWAKNENDARLIDRILAGDAPGVLSEAEAHHNACVPGAAAAALTGAYQLGARQARLLAYGSSYDIQPGSTFVGYAGITFQRESP